MPDITDHARLSRPAYRDANIRFRYSRTPVLCSDCGIEPAERPNDTTPLCATCAAAWLDDLYQRHPWLRIKNAILERTYDPVARFLLRLG